ncbi:MAG: ATP-dependent acyl-CoA ligase, partial [Ferrovibrionaceae bacterium]
MTIASLYDAFAEASADTPELDFLATTPSCGGTVLTYGEAAARVEALSARYRACGWGAGHRIALNLGSQPLHFLHFLALN